VTILVMVLGIAVAVAAFVSVWNLPLPRRWWHLLLFVGTYPLPALVGYVGGLRLRQLVRESKAGRTSQGIVDQTD
jgi:hypothetical protein